MVAGNDNMVKVFSRSVGYTTSVAIKYGQDNICLWLCYVWGELGIKIY
jgi:hypothetical protein